MSSEVEPPSGGLQPGGESEPSPAKPEPSPVEPEPSPAEPEPSPVEPEPSPVEPEPSPVEPEPSPAEPDPSPLEPEPSPAEPEPSPAEPGPSPVEPDPSRLEPEPWPAEPVAPVAAAVGRAAEPVEPATARVEQRADGLRELVHGFWATASHARCQQQQKCVELSLQVTLALAGACALVVARSVILDRSAPPSDTARALAFVTGDETVLGVRVKDLIVFVVFLYALIETLILANYVFQTFYVNFCNIRRSLLTREFEWSMVVLERKDARPRWVWRIGACLINLLQPLVIYFSVFMGWLLVWGLLLLWGWFAKSRWWLALPIGGVFSLLVLAAMHTYAEGLAGCRDWRDCERARRDCERARRRGTG